MPLSRPRHRKKHHYHPAWTALLKERIDAAAKLGILFNRPVKGSTSKVYEDSITDAIRAGDVKLTDILSSPEITAKGKTQRRWRKAAAYAEWAYKGGVS